MNPRNAAIVRAWRGERTQELAAAIIGVSTRTLQRAEEGDKVNLVVIRTIEMCYACEVVVPAVIVSARGLVVWRNGLAAAIGVGDLGQTFFGGFLSSYDGEHIGSPAERAVALIAGKLRPTLQSRAVYVWRADGSAPIYRARYLDLGGMFKLAGGTYLYTTFAAEVVSSVGA